MRFRTMQGTKKNPTKRCMSIDVSDYDITSLSQSNTKLFWIISVEVCFRIVGPILPIFSQLKTWTLSFCVLCNWKLPFIIFKIHKRCPRMNSNVQNTKFHNSSNLLKFIRGSESVCISSFQYMMIMRRIRNIIHRQI